MAVVLVVDDDEAIRMLLEVVLGDEHDVHSAVDGDDGLSQIERIEPDLVILDVMMPKLDGWSVLRGMRARNIGRKTRVIMLTASAAERDFVAGWRLGVAEYMTKPFDPEDLTRVVRITLQSSDEEIINKRRHELEKTDLLQRIESAFGEGPSE